MKNKNELFITVLKFVFFSVSLCLVSCVYEDEDDWDDSIFVADSDDYHLPAYSEMGYNTFGAKFNRSYFLYSDDFSYSSRSSPCSFFAKKDSFEIIFYGEVDNYTSKDDYFIISFEFATNEVLDDFTDLILLDSTSYDLSDSVSCIVKIQKENMTEKQVVEVERGSFSIVRAQNVYVNESLRYTALSGYFDLKFLYNGEIINIEKGRYDVAIIATNM